jgi:hypothetical protein
MRDVGARVLGSVAPGDAALAPGSSSAMDLGVSRLYLSGSPGFPPPPHELEAGGGRGKVCVFMGLNYREVVARDTGLSRPEHPTLDSG